MARAKAGQSMPARDDVRETETVDAASAAARVRELELHVNRLAQANRQLAEREASLRAIFDAGPDAVALVGRDGTILDLNPAGRDLIELDASFRPIGVRLDMLATDPHRTACRSLATRVFRGEAATVELEIQGLRGRRRWIEIHATPLRGDDGTVSALVCVSRDITARRAAEAALRDREARWRGVFGSPMIGILFWDQRRRDHRRQRRPPAAGRLLARGPRGRPRLVARDDAARGAPPRRARAREPDRHRRLRSLREALHPQGRVARADRDRRGADRRLARSRRRLRAGHHGAAGSRGPAPGERGAVPQHGGAFAADPVDGRGRRPLRLRQPELARLQRRAARRRSRGGVLRRGAPRRRRGRPGGVPAARSRRARAIATNSASGGGTASTAT